MAMTIWITVILCAYSGSKSICTSNLIPNHYNFDPDDTEFFCNLVHQDSLPQQAEWRKIGEINAVTINICDHTIKTYLDFNGSSFVCHAKRSAIAHSFRLSEEIKVQYSWTQQIALLPAILCIGLFSICLCKSNNRDLRSRIELLSDFIIRNPAFSMEITQNEKIQR